MGLADFVVGVGLELRRRSVLLASSSFLSFVVGWDFDVSLVLRRGLFGGLASPLFVFVVNVNLTIRRRAAPRRSRGACLFSTSLSRCVSVSPSLVRGFLSTGIPDRLRLLVDALHC